VPEATDGAVGTTPVLITGSFLPFIQAGTDVGDFLPSTPKSIYTFTGTIGDGSMNAGNLFGPIEQAVFGSTPADFEVFEFTWTFPTLDSNVPYEFDVLSGPLPAGTILAASAGSNPFSTPWTTAGLVCGYPAPGAPPLCDNQPPPPPVPEPATFALMGLGFLGLGLAARRRRSVRA
jgi:hypothetical protein